MGHHDHQQHHHDHQQHHHHHDPGHAAVLDLDGEVLASHLEAILDWAAAGLAPAVVADLGAGTGTGTRLLARRFPEAMIVAVDQSGSLLGHLRAHLPPFVRRRPRGCAAAPTSRCGARASPGSRGGGRLSRMSHGVSDALPARIAQNAG